MYVFDGQNGLFQFTAPFLERVRDLQSFRMTQKFFSVFPELRADIDLAHESTPSPSYDRNMGFPSILPQDTDVDPLHNPHTEGDFISQLNWPGNQANMRVGEV
jgi:hypothetical protein